MALAIVLIALGLGFLSSLPSLTRTRLGRALLPEPLNPIVDVNKTANLSASLATPTPVPVPSTGKLIAQPIRFPRNPGGGSGDEVFFRYLVKYGEATKLLIGINDNADDEISFWQAGAERLTIVGGNVGIGDTSPLYLLTVGSGDLFGVNSSGYALLPAGAVGTPSLSFTADTNTGLWSSAADTLNFSTGGSERVRVDSSGNVGIGTTGPVERLHVVGNFAINRGNRIGLRGDGGDAWGEFITSTSPALDIRLATGNVYRLTITNTGNVGIGTTGPTRLLQLSKSANVPIQFNVTNAAVDTKNWQWIAHSNGFFQGQIANDADNTLITWLEVERSGMSITDISFPGGNVGIGTASPGQKLEIDGGMRLNTATSKPTCGSTTRGTFWVTQGGTGVKDAVEVCAKDATDAYAWRTIY